MTTDKNKPLHTVNLGSVHAAIFPQRGDKGSFLSVTLHRNYKDGDDWKQTNTYTARQLASLIAVAHKALDFVLEAQGDVEEQPRTSHAKIRARA